MIDSILNNVASFIITIVALYFLFSILVGWVFDDDGEELMDAFNSRIKQTIKSFLLGGSTK